MVIVEDLVKVQLFYSLGSLTAGSDIHVLNMIWLVFFVFVSNVPLKLVEMMSGQLRRAFESRTSEQCLIFIIIIIIL